MSKEDEEPALLLYETWKNVYPLFANIRYVCYHCMEFYVYIPFKSDYIAMTWLLESCKWLWFKVTLTLCCHY
jgi:hypothetical protein